MSYSLHAWQLVVASFCCLGITAIVALVVFLVIYFRRGKKS